MNLAIYIIYAIFMIFCCIADFTIKNNNIKRAFYILATISFSLLAMFRAEHVADTTSYIEYYDKISTIGYKGFFNIDKEFELGFEFLTKIIALSKANFRFYFFIIAFLQILLCGSIFKDSKFRLCAIACYISYYGIYFSFTILRAGFSILFFMLGILKSHKRPVATIFCFCLSFLFHQSALAAIILYFVICRLKKPLNYKFAFLSISILFVIYVTGFGSQYIIKPIFQYLSNIPSTLFIWRKAVGYMRGFADYSYLISFRYIFVIIIYCFGNFFINKDDKLYHDKKIGVLDRLYFMGIFITAFMGTGTISSRLTDYIYFLSILYALIISNEFLRAKVSGFNFAKLPVRVLLFITLYILMNMIFIYRFIEIGG